MSFAHFAALFVLFSEPGMTGAQLARRSLVSAQTINAVLSRLETEQLVERRPHPDSLRADSWHLTEEGTLRLAQARAVGDTVFSRMLSALRPDEVQCLQSYLRRCIDALGQAPPGSADARL
jgi:DNA-binding MarR family transcriptional regulator